MDEKYSDGRSSLVLGIILLVFGIVAFIYGSNENPYFDFEITRQQDILLITSYIVIFVSFILIAVGIFYILKVKK
jgi:uncharacterized membrane protein